MRNIQPPRGLIDGKIVPTARTGDGNLFDYAIATGEGMRCADKPKAQREDTESAQSPTNEKAHHQFANPFEFDPNLLRQPESSMKAKRS
jgi:hypothetical protein